MSNHTAAVAENDSPPPSPSTILQACCANEALQNDTDSLLRAMDSTLGSNQTDAVLTILDSKSIHRLEAPHMSLTLCRSNDRKEYYLCVYHPGCMVYCSCRSFEEKCKASEPALCKHLMALKVQPLLSTDSSCVVVEKYPTAKAFSRSVQQKLSIIK